MKEGRSTLIFSGALILVLLVAVLSVGNKVKDILVTKKDKVDGSWMYTKYKNLEAVQSQYDRWPELFDETAKLMGMDSFKQWSTLLAEGKQVDGASPVEMQDALMKNFRYHVKLQNASHTAIDMYNDWQNQEWFTEKYFRGEMELNSSWKWFLWKVYVFIYSI